MMSGGVLKAPTMANGASVMQRASSFKGRVLPTYATHPARAAFA
jgi:hypothetical protein